jgi:hypothetical protein
MAAKRVATRRVTTDDPALRALIAAGDIDGTFAHLAALSAGERSALRPFVRDLMASTERAYERRPNAPDASAPADIRQWRCLVAAAIASDDLASILLAADQPPTFVRAVRELRPACAPELAARLVEGGRRGYLPLARRLVAEGVSDHPTTSDDYVLAFFDFDFLRGESYDNSRSMWVALLDDEAHLALDVDRLFDVEGTSEMSLANHDRGVDAQRTFTTALIELADAGMLDRVRLLDRTLEVLQRDWPAFRAGWFSRFHDALAPTAEQIAARAPIYRALLASSIPATVAMAVLALTRLDEVGGAQDHEARIDALAPVMLARAKRTALAGLALLERSAIEVTSRARAAAAVAAQALGHESADVQAAALGFLERHGSRADHDLAESVRERLAVVAPTQRARVRAWLGDEQEGGVAAPAPAPSPDPSPASSPAPARGAIVVGPARGGPIAPIADADELLLRVAYVLENDDDVQEIERVFGGLARLGSDAAVRSSLSQLKKRAEKLREDQMTERVFGAELARCVLSLGAARLEPRRSRFPWLKPADLVGRVRDAVDLFTDRIDAVVLHVLDPARAGLPLLATPTELPANVDPAALVARVASYEERAALPDPLDAEIALLRLTTKASTAERAEAARDARSLTSDMGRAVRRALGGADLPKDARLAIAASRARDPEADDPELDAVVAAGAGIGRVARYPWTVERWHINEHDYPGLTFTRTPALPDVDHGALTVALHRGVTSTHRDRALPGNERGETKIGGPRVGTVRYLASLWPAQLDPFFVEGAVALAGNIDFGSSHPQYRAYLEPLLARTTAWSEAASVLLAIGLSSKPSDEVALAVDAMAIAAEDGRLPVDAFGAVLRRMLPAGVVKIARWAKSFARVAAVSSVTADVAVRSLELALQGEVPGALPRDLASAVELVLELRTASPGRPLPTATRAYLSALPKSGKLEKVKRALLA